MKQRLASLGLLLVLFGGAFAGIPMRFGESECGMGMGAMADMSDMDCCKMALMQSESREATAAKLCCALICAQNGSTSPPSVVRVTPPAQAAQPTHPALSQPLPGPLVIPEHFGRAHSPPGSPPTYLRNLTLLI